MSAKKLITSTLLFSAFAVALSFSTSFAQKAKKETQEAAPAATSQPAPATKTSRTETDSLRWLNVYTLAKRYGDFPTALNSLYWQLAGNPKSIALKDSLATLYFIAGSNYQAIALGKEVLEAEPSNQKVLEMVAIAYQNVGAAKESLEQYEKLFKLSSSVFHQYQIGILQFYLQRYGECSMTLNGVIANPKSGEEKIAIAVNREQRQEVLLKAAAMNVIGVMLREQKDNENARKAFQAALQAQPDFVLPKGNLEDMDKPAPAPGKTGK